MVIGGCTALVKCTQIAYCTNMDVSCFTTNATSYRVAASYAEKVNHLGYVVMVVEVVVWRFVLAVLYSNSGHV